jgi:hypothetical protein
MLMTRPYSTAGTNVGGVDLALDDKRLFMESEFGRSEPSYRWWGEGLCSASVGIS